MLVVEQVEIFNFDHCCKVASGPGYTCARRTSGIDYMSGVGLLSGCLGLLGYWVRLVGRVILAAKRAMGCFTATVCLPGFATAAFLGVARFEGFEAEV